MKSGIRHWRIWIRRIPLTLLSVMGTVAGPAQTQSYVYDHFNISRGLISDNILKIYSDRDGLAWILTYNGLQKYNGYDFKTYTSASGWPGSLTSNFVEDILEDREGDLIVVFEDGIDIYKKETDRFTNLIYKLPHVPSRRDEISRYASAAQDATGAIWVNCNNQLVRIDSQKKDFTVFPEEFRGRFVLNRDSTQLWIISDRTVKRYDLRTRILTMTDLSQIPGAESISRLHTIFFDSENQCWIGASEGLYHFDADLFRFTDPGYNGHMRVENDPGPVDRSITAIYEDYRKDLWVASGAVLHRIVRQTGKIETLRHETENPNSILDAQITGIHGDRSGTIWVTYLNEGFTRINIREHHFRSYRFNPNQSESLGGHTVRSIFKDPGGYLWLGLYNDGLDRVDPRTGSIDHFKHVQGDPHSICSNYISSVMVDSRNRLWVGSHDHGLCFADGVYGTIISFRVPDFLRANEEIYHISEDSLGRIWFGTREGLGVFDYRTMDFAWILSGYNVQSFVFDGTDIWIASWNSGLIKLHFLPEQFSSSVPEIDRTRSILGNGKDAMVNGAGREISSENAPGNCISIYLDPSKNIWLGTYDRGLVRVRENSGGFEVLIYDVSKGAPGNAVYGVSGDRQGKIWISTENGIGRFDPETEHFDNFFREDGLLSDFFMWKSYFRAPDGELFFGNADGVNHFYPEEIVRESADLMVRFSEVRIHNEVVERGDTVNGEVILAKHIDFQDTLILNHLNNDFSLRYYVPGHPNPSRLIYAHMLSGIDQKWIEDTYGNRTASYHNLRPGTYYFRVLASEIPGVHSGDFTEKMVVVLPPWWKTRLAFVFYVVLISGLLALISRSLIRFLSLKHELIYSEKLHQSKLMFFTNLSHEFKTPLSMIKAPLDELLKEKDQHPHAIRNIQLARKSADQLLNLVAELMEFRRTESGISRLRCERIEITSFIREIATQFELLAEQKGIHFYHHIPSESIPLWADRKKFSRIVNNLLENALKYTDEEGLVTLSIVTHPERHRFKPGYHTLLLNETRKGLAYIGILVSDTGVGISGESLPRIFDRFFQIEAEQAGYHIGSGIGLALVKNLVMMHQGVIHVASERGAGTEILVLLPLGDRHLRDEDKTVGMDESGRQEPAEPPKERKKKEGIPPAEALRIPGLPIILLVEDHAGLRDYLSENLSADYHILEASQGEEALRILRCRPVDLVVADWIMPVMDGSRLIREIRADEAISSIPVILLTAKDELKDLQEGLDLGADLVISKPFNLQLLVTQIGRTIKNNRERIRNYSTVKMEQVEQVHRSRDVQYMTEMERIISRNLRNADLNAAFLSREMGVSRTVLYDRVRSITGLTIGEHIQQLRLKHAIKLMLYQGLSVSEVYLMVGFNSSSYMIRLFKKYYHTTPGEYIRLYLKTASN